MQNQLNSKTKEYSQKYGNLAKGFIELNPSMAKQYFDIAKEIDPNYTSTEYSDFMKSYK